MATAERLLGQLQTIDININGQSDTPDLILTEGQLDSLTFNNLAPFPVKIVFVCANGPVFNDVPRIEADKPQGSSQFPQKGQITVNYNIVNLNTGLSQGPYGIQVGIGTPSNPAPLLIPITSGNPPSNLAKISVPLGGWIEFNLDAQYTITWNPANAFNTPAPPTPVGAGPYQAQTGNQVTVAQYTLTSKNARGVTGGGTVKINS